MHIFLTHSNLTTILVLAIIKQKKIDLNDVCIIPFRGVSIIFDAYTLSLDMPYPMGNYLIKMNNKKRKELIRFIDHQISQFIGSREFTFYAPNYSEPIAEIISTHKKCKKKCYLEDGLSSYNSYSSQLKLYRPSRSFIGRLKYFINFGSRFGYSGIISPLCTQFFTLSSEALPGKDVHDLGNYVLQMAKNSSGKINFQANCVLFVFDALVAFGIMKYPELRDGVVKFIEDYFQDVGRVYVKFHPSQDSIERDNIIRDCFSNIEDLEIIPDNIFIELEIWKRTDMIIYGILSSVLLYSGMLSRNSVNSTIAYFPSLQNLKLPDAFYKYVNIL